MGKDLKGNELGEGIIQKKTGRYEARFVNRFGKRVSFSGRNLKEVKKRFNEALYENDQKLNLKTSITLRQWYAEWMEVYKFDSVRPTTKMCYNQVYAKHIAAALGDYPLNDISQLIIKRHLNAMKRSGISFETRNKVRIMLVDMFDKAIINEYARKNPARGITLKRDEQREVRVLSEEEQILFFDCAKGTFYDNLFVVAVTTGMRVGEIAALRWSDIDWNKNIIHVSRTLLYMTIDDDTEKTFHFGDPKTRTSVRDIPINRQCELALKKQYVQKRVVEEKAPASKRPSEEFRDLLFTTKYNTPITSQHMCDAIDKILGEVNLMRDPLDEIERFSMHCFRHTFATRCFEAGIQPKTVQSYLGHASLQMTMDLYTSVLPKHSSDEMYKFADALDKLNCKGETLIEQQYAALCKPKNVVSFRGDGMVAQ